MQRRELRDLHVLPMPEAWGTSWRVIDDLDFCFVKANPLGKFSDLGLGAPSRHFRCEAS